MAKKKKATVRQKQAKKLWNRHLKGHIVGFICPCAGQNEKSLARVDKAVQKGNLDAVKKEFDQLKKTDEGFLCPIFVERQIDPDKTDKSTNQTRVGNKTYKIPEPEVKRKLQNAWEKFSSSIEQVTIKAPS